MREIKFRAISKMPIDEMDAKGIPHRSKFVFGAYSDGYILGPVIEANEEFISHEWWVPVEKETVEQYTVLDDESYHGAALNGDPLIIVFDNSDGQFMAINPRAERVEARSGSFVGLCDLLDSLGANPARVRVEFE